MLSVKYDILERLQSWNTDPFLYRELCWHVTSLIVKYFKDFSFISSINIQTLLRGLNAFGTVSVIFIRDTTLVTSCLLFHHLMANKHIALKKEGCQINLLNFFLWSRFDMVWMQSTCICYSFYAIFYVARNTCLSGLFGREPVFGLGDKLVLAVLLIGAYWSMSEYPHGVGT